MQKFNTAVSRRCRGAVPIVVLYLVGLLAATQLVPNWRLPALFAKGPGTEQLRAAEAKAADAAAAAAKAKSDYEAALQKQRDDTRQQVQYSQQMATGVAVALGSAPVSPPVVLAISLNERVVTGLSAAIGALPADKQAEIATIVASALSAKQAEIDAAKAALAQKDAELISTTKEKLAVEARLPGLEQKASDAESTAQHRLQQVALATQEVAAYADKAAQKEKENGSLNTLVTNLLKGIGVSALLYALAHIILPSLAQEFPAIGWLGAINRTVKSVSSSHL